MSNGRGDGGSEGDGGGWKERTERMHTWLNPKDPSRPKRKREGAKDEGAMQACREKPKGVKREGGRKIYVGALEPQWRT